MNKTIYALLRIAIGTSMLVHGLVRLPKLAEFSAGMVTKFQKSMLPIGLVKPFSLALPFIEFLIGILLLLGLLTKQTLMAACIFMTVLILGSGLTEDWNPIALQLIHIAFFITLLVFIEHNKIALDYLIRRKQ